MIDTIKKINTARRMPSKVLIESATRLAKRMIRRYAIKFHPVKLSDEDFLKATRYKTIDEFLNRNLSHFLFNLNDKERIVETL
jgi:hypothetical protein